MAIPWRQPSPYKCPVHGYWLLPDWFLVNAVRGSRWVRSFACPVETCDYRKPDKWQGGRRSRTFIQSA